MPMMLNVTNLNFEMTKAPLTYSAMSLRSLFTDRTCLSSYSNSKEPRGDEKSLNF